MTAKPGKRGEQYAAISTKFVLASCWPSFYRHLSASDLHWR